MRRRRKIPGIGLTKMTACRKIILFAVSLKGGLGDLKR